MYSLIQPATKGSPVLLNAVNNEPLKVESAFIDQDTGMVNALLFSSYVLASLPEGDIFLACCAWPCLMHCQMC